MKMTEINTCGSDIVPCMLESIQFLFCDFQFFIHGWDLFTKRIILSLSDGEKDYKLIQYLPAETNKMDE